MNKRRLIGRFPTLPANRCIYCGATDVPLTEEHIIPQSLGGQTVLQRASCGKCAEQTRDFERKCCDEIFNPVRKALGIKGKNRGRKYRKQYRPTISVRTDKQAIQRRVVDPIDDPRGLNLPLFAGGPPLLETYVFSEQRLLPQIWRAGPSPDVVVAWANRLQVGGVVLDFDLLAFGRLLAKIAHGMVIVTYPQLQFKPLLTDLIRGASNEWKPFIGSCEDEEVPKNVRHNVQVRDFINGWGTAYIGCNVRLFAQVGAPTYRVIVGRLPQEDKQRWPYPMDWEWDNKVLFPARGSSPQSSWRSTIQRLLRAFKRPWVNRSHP